MAVLCKGDVTKMQRTFRNWNAFCWGRMEWNVCYTRSFFFVEKRFIFLLFHNAAFSFVCFVSFFFQRNYFIFLLWDSNSLETFFLFVFVTLLREDLSKESFTEYRFLVWKTILDCKQWFFTEDSQEFYSLESFEVCQWFMLFMEFIFNSCINCFVFLLCITLFKFSL